MTHNRQHTARSTDARKGKDLYWNNTVHAIPGRLWTVHGDNVIVEVVVVVVIVSLSEGWRSSKGQQQDHYDDRNQTGKRDRLSFCSVFLHFVSVLWPVFLFAFPTTPVESRPVPSTIKYSKKALMHLLEAIRSLLPHGVHHSREISIAFRKPPHCCIRTVVAGDVPASAAHVIATECCYFVLMLAKGTMTITKCFLSFSALRWYFYHRSCCWYFCR